ncbi:MAG: DUF4126 domain-containing protein [Ignavibacteria bacterium]|nr:DUF4126 domain-containing protein [Ignavibacteria bacterium]MBK7157313.1 DUF4126 domain-containing protein [Ignavibacteria bacterium]MBK7255004.1 DUF4126 domain-containing protein [Ignavibacteria bacterium]MBK8380928.1 DUF4126 domain-containing protein [Ignavibacteria bacterium]MBK9405476.1 DUF4126 domain-containing protein [Ignavibacteria bacterium]
MDLYLKILIGLGLSAASGFRLFVPFAILSIFSISGIYNTTSTPFIFSSDLFLVIFIILSVSEVLLFYNPWIDNMLDLISTPASIFSGIIITYFVLYDTEIYLRLLISVILGGLVSLNVQLLTVKARSSTSIFSKGNGNQIVSTIENISSIFISILVLKFPLAGIFVSAIIIYLIYTFIIKKGRQVRK